MSNLSDLLPAGAGAKSATFTASGTLPSGQVVILNTDGTVSSVTQSSSSTGTPVNFNAGSSRTFMETAVVYHPVQDKTVFFYCDSGSSNYGKAIVGTVSGTSISFSGATEFTWESGTVGEIAAVYDSNIDRIILVYENASNYTEAKVITVSGNSLSTSGASGIGGVTNYEDNSVCFDSSSNKTIFAASSQTNSGYGHARVLTATVGSVSSGTVVTFQSNSVRLGQAVYDVNANKTVIFYGQSGTGGKAIVGTVSGTDITFGTAATFSTAGSDAYNVAGAYDSDNYKVVVAYRTALGANDGNANVGTVSGTDITFGSAVQYLATSADHTAIVYDATAKKMVIAFCDANADGELVEGTVSGDSISFTSPTTYQSGGVSDLDKAGAYDSTAGKTVFSYQLDSNFDNYAFVHQSAATDSANFVGITDEAIANAATGSVVVEGGVITNSSFNIALVTGTETNLTGKTQSPYPVITYDITNSKFVVFFQDGNNSNYGTSVVVTVSGTTVTFGTPVVFNSGSTNYIDATYSESNGKHLVVYPDYGNSQQATAIVGTVSGTSISFGSEQVYDTGTVNTRVSVAYNSNLDKYLAGSTPSSGTINVTVLTVSGTTVSAGTPVSLSGTKYKPNIASNESASDFVLGNNKNDNQSEAHLISVSGTVPTVETSIDLSAVVSSSFPSTGLAFLESNKFVCVYSDNSTNSMYTRTITVSGTSLSLGTASSAFTVDPNPQTSINGAWPLFKATTTSAYLYYQDDTSNYLKYVPISISGTTATSGTEVTYTSQTSDYEGFLYSADAKQGLSFFQSTDSGQQTAAIAQNASLTTGSTYYVQDDGSLSTTSSSVTAGKALSSTTLLLKG
jgi:hypothetical protein